MFIRICIHSLFYDFYCRSFCLWPFIFIPPVISKCIVLSFYRHFIIIFFLWVTLLLYCFIFSCVALLFDVPLFYFYGFPISSCIGLLFPLWFYLYLYLIVILFYAHLSFYNLTSVPMRTYIGVFSSPVMYSLV